jgi:hypothetical protein
MMLAEFKIKAFAILVIFLRLRLLLSFFGIIKKQGFILTTKFSFMLSLQYVEFYGLIALKKLTHIFAVSIWQSGFSSLFFMATPFFPSLTSARSKCEFSLES